MKELDLTRGRVPKVLLKFAIPFLMASFLQALYGGADLFVVGQFSDSASTSAVAIGSQVMQMVTGMMMGLTTGMTVLIAIATGERNEQQTVRTIGTGAVLFLIIGVLLSFLMTLGHQQITAWMHTPQEAVEATESYLMICSLGVLFIVGYNVVCGILRGMGDSRTPLYFIAIACVINLVLDFVLVKGYSLGATGAAIATIGAQGISFLLSLTYLRYRGFHFKIAWQDFQLRKERLRKILMLGLPIALQDGLINLSFLIIAVIINQMGLHASAALGVDEKLIIFAMLPPIAISSAVATMVAQNYGAGLVKRMTQTLLYGIGFSLIFEMAFCLYVQMRPDDFTSIFSVDPTVISLASAYLQGYSIDCIMVSFIFCINSYFSGQGNSVFPMIHSLIATFFFRIPLSYLASKHVSAPLLAMGYAAPASTMVSLMICIGYFYWMKRQRSYQILLRA